MIALRIDWIDSVTWSNLWMDDKELAELELRPIVSRGELVKETPVAIFLAQSITDNEHRNIIGIPKGCILKQRKIP